MRLCAKLFLAGFLVLGSARADVVTIAASGAFDHSAPTGLLTSPDAAWSMSVTLDRQPIGSVGGTSFIVAQFYDFSYILNNTPIAIRPNRIEFGEAAFPFFVADFGIFIHGEFDFLTSSRFYFGTTIFPGDCGCTSPTLIPGNYPIFGGVANFEGLDNQGGLIVAKAGTASLNISAAAVPEPSSFLLMGCAIGALGLFRRKAEL